MLTQSNRHIKKYNQLVEVYGPEGIDPIERVTARDEAYLEGRMTDIAEQRTQVEELTEADFFDPERRTEIEETEGLSTPESVADSQRADMLDRLDAIEDSLSSALADPSPLDASDDLGF